MLITAFYTCFTIIWNIISIEIYYAIHYSMFQMEVNILLNLWKILHDWWVFRENITISVERRRILLPKYIIIIMHMRRFFIKKNNHYLLSLFLNFFTPIFAREFFYFNYFVTSSNSKSADTWLTTQVGFNVIVYTTLLQVVLQIVITSRLFINVYCFKYTHLNNYLLTHLIVRILNTHFTKEITGIPLLAYFLLRCYEYVVMQSQYDSHIMHETKVALWNTRVS